VVEGFNRESSRSTLACYHVCFRRRPPGAWWAHALGLVAFTAVALPWPIAVMRMLPAAREIWWAESVAQLSEVSDQHRPWHYYAPQWLLMALPWTPLLVWGAILRIRRRRESSGPAQRDLRPWFPLAWFLVTVVFFSFVDMKKNAYLLPAAPALVMLTAQCVATTLAWLRRECFDKGAGIFAGAMGVLGVGAAVAMLAVTLRPFESLAAGASLVAIVMAVRPLLLFAKGNVDARRWIWRQAAAFAVVLCLYAGFWRAAQQNRRSPREAAVIASQIAEERGGTVELPQGLPHVGVYVPSRLICPPPDGTPTVAVGPREYRAELARARSEGKPIPHGVLPTEVGGLTGSWRVWDFQAKR
jgi:4-amino-4-deoxy-L-arabinose transferase-like glycosyltransferase